MYCDVIRKKKCTKKGDGWPPHLFPYVSFVTLHSRMGFIIPFENVRMSENVHFSPPETPIWVYTFRAFSKVHLSYHALLSAP